MTEQTEGDHPIITQGKVYSLGVTGVAEDVAGGTGLRAVERCDAEVRVGLDLMEVAQVEQAVTKFGERYLQRVFTPHELGCCQGEPSARAAGLASRFAAKEAVMKVLRPLEEGLDWRSIEVRRHRGGWCDLNLGGQAGRLAARAGVQKLALSMSHEAGMAGAVVVALCGSP